MNNSISLLLHLRNAIDYFDHSFLIGSCDLRKDYRSKHLDTALGDESRIKVSAFGFVVFQEGVSECLYKIF